MGLREGAMESLGIMMGLEKSELGQVSPNFWAGKRVFITGHTGFKGGWLSIWLASMGAKVSGYALPANTNPSLFIAADVGGMLEKNNIADINDLLQLNMAINQANPDIVFHLAAQPLVRYSYSNPLETYRTNVMGTVNLLESIRRTKNVRAVVVVTTDKCYKNQEWVWGYREYEPLGGADPYSSSKACAELVTSAYRQSFFAGGDGVLLASARAGNVIGGGDWSLDRLIPDALRAFEFGKPLELRNPMATRPWQHVLEPLSGYLVLAQTLIRDGVIAADAWNFGPYEDGNKTVKQVIDMLGIHWGLHSEVGNSLLDQPHEAQLLKLDCSKAARHLHWMPKWTLKQAVEKIIEWHQAFESKKNMRDVCLKQIEAYMQSSID